MGAADTTMILTRRRGEPNGTLAIVGRDIIEDGEFAVRFDKETAKWTLIGPAAQMKAETEQQESTTCCWRPKRPWAQLI